MSMKTGRLELVYKVPVDESTYTRMKFTLHYFSPEEKNARLRELAAMARGLRDYGYEVNVIQYSDEGNVLI